VAIELTANEWKEAREKGDRYRVMLVAKCHCERPVIQFIDAPYGACESGLLIVEPAVYSVRRILL
jgi:hypothetical protein